MSIWAELNKIENRADERKPETLKTPQAHIVDADGSLADITTKFNTLLSELETAGILSSS